MKSAPATKPITLLTSKAKLTIAETSLDMAKRMEAKAASIRARVAEQPMQPDDYYPVIDYDQNVKLLCELDNLGKKLHIASYIVLHQVALIGSSCEPVATVLFKRSENQMTAYAKLFINSRIHMHKKTVRGVGYDRETACLHGCTFYPHTREFPKITIDDRGGDRWYKQLANAEYKVYRVL